jgi:hypothetical protein
LLLYRFNRRAAEVVRVVFYVWVVVVIAFAFINEAGSIFRRVVLPAVFLGWGVILRYWAVALEARGGSAEAPAASSADTAKSNKQLAN